MASPWFNIRNPNNVKGAWETDAQRIEEIYLARRADNRAGHKPKTKEPWGLMRRASEQAELSPIDISAEPAKPKGSKQTLERRLSLEEMARQLTGKTRHA
jgi:hypothetical protein